MICENWNEFQAMGQAAVSDPKIKDNKEKAAFAVLTAIGCLLAVLLVFYPYMPNPNQIVETLYRPLGKLLEK